MRKEYASMYVHWCMCMRFQVNYACFSFIFSIKHFTDSWLLNDQPIGIQFIHICRVYTSTQRCWNGSQVTWYRLGFLWRFMMVYVFVGVTFSPVLLSGHLIIVIHFYFTSLQQLYKYTLYLFDRFILISVIFCLEPDEFSILCL